MNLEHHTYFIRLMMCNLFALAQQLLKNWHSLRSERDKARKGPIYHGPIQDQFIMINTLQRLPMLILRLPMLMLRLPMLMLRLPMLSPETLSPGPIYHDKYSPKTSNVNIKTSNVNVKTSNVNVKTSNVNVKTSNVKPRNLLSRNNLSW